ncbi:hypothetical protein BEN47_15560 [Hymenobacter lapidarius]|uniref:Lipocalin-like domain-containing protein n=1 Tax=Hymenobacter lapidarius TaxID=1908237 RepID=A0A1G1T279_9BACT|nr:hypothetical protein BEN47_15560 [Hymenobacter lapidarius]
MEGTWDLKTETEYLYDSKGALAATHGPFTHPQQKQAVISADYVVTLIMLATPVQTSRFAYSRQGNVLSILNTNTEIDIKKLTAHSLVLLYRYPPNPPNSQYARAETEYTYDR